MEQYLQALREREDVSEEVLLELEERFKVVEEIIDIEVEPTEIQMLRDYVLDLDYRVIMMEFGL